ncbi:MAG: hypothetical protein E7667_05915 [Ruminococcaceae bacterium]|nr:hypothetical protein [Oscillospiraceae bacterium]
MKGLKKNLIRSTIAALICILLIVGSIVPVFAASTQPSSYSKSANSGQRHVVCTTLSGTSAGSYYTGSYTYDALDDLSASSLLSSLRTLMSSTHKKITSYANCRDYANITDCENGNGTSIVTLYTSYSSSHSEYSGGSGWNREHVWPKSLGGFDTENAGADLHHIRPSESRTNSQRGNLKYGNVSSNSPITGNMSGLNGGYKGSYYEPLDNVKGDVARICLYVYVRWGGQYSECSNITNVFQSVDVLLEWCELDPVDTWEMGRNEVVQSIQGNRNVFIDYPEYAWMLFGKEVPDDMVTPSGNAMNGSSSTPTDKPTTPTEKPTEKPDEPSVDVGCGTLESPLTPTQVLAANSHLAQGESSDNPFYVRGVVKSIGQTGDYYKNVYVTDGESDFLIYTINMSSGISGFEVGDTITAYGYVKNYNGTIEMASKNVDGGGQIYVMCVAVGIEEPPVDPDDPTDTPVEPPVDDPTDDPIDPPVDDPTDDPTDPPPVDDPTDDPIDPPVDDPTDDPDPSKPCTHENTILSGVKPSCTEIGYSGDKICVDCEKVLVLGTTIPVSGHSFGDPEVVTPATEESIGFSKSVCENCGQENILSIPMLGTTNDGNTEDGSGAGAAEEDTAKQEATAKPEEISKSGCGVTISVSLVGFVSAIAAGFVLSKKKK